MEGKQPDVIYELNGMPVVEPEAEIQPKVMKDNPFRNTDKPDKSEIRVRTSYLDGLCPISEGENKPWPPADWRPSRFSKSSGLHVGQPLPPWERTGPLGGPLQMTGDSKVDDTRVLLRRRAPVDEQYVPVPHLFGKYKFLGSREEWLELLGALNPGHCSYPDGRPINSRGAPCRQRSRWNGRCRHHGGSESIGFSSKGIKNGRYSRYLPTKMAYKYEESMQDPELLSLQSDVALLEARIKELTECMPAGCTAERWNLVKDCHELVVAAFENESIDKLELMIQKMGSVIDEEVKTKEQWDEIAALVEAKARTSSKEHARMRDLGQYLSIPQALSLIGLVTNSVSRRIKDRGILLAIQADISQVLDGKRIPHTQQMDFTPDPAKVVESK